MSVAVTLRRASDGLGLLVLLAAGVVPVFAVAASVHRAHWLGVGVDTFWSGFLVPGAARCWALVLTVLIVGWAAGAAPAEPGRARRVMAGLGLGAFAAGLCLLAALPAWFWLVRLGTDAAVMSSALLAVVGPLVGAMVAGGTGPVLGEAAGAGLGGAAGLGLVWAAWGAFV